MPRGKGMPRAMRLEAMSKEGKHAHKSRGKTITAEKGPKVPKFPPKGLPMNTLPLSAVKPVGKSRGVHKGSVDKKLEAPHRRREKAAKSGKKK